VHVLYVTTFSLWEKGKKVQDVEKSGLRDPQLGARFKSSMKKGGSGLDIIFFVFVCGWLRLWWEL